MCAARAGHDARLGGAGSVRDHRGAGRRAPARRRTHAGHSAAGARPDTDDQGRVLMSELRPFALLRTGDQWLRCWFDRAALDPDAGVVSLASMLPATDSIQAPPPIAGGLVFDHECRLY